MGCHGIPGYHNAYPNYPVPRVGGQHPEYIVAALKAYKSGQRGHGTMQAQAASLSEQDMQRHRGVLRDGGQRLTVGG